MRGGTEVALAVGAAASGAAAAWWLLRRRALRLAAELAACQDALDRMAEFRREERAGRTRAEVELRTLLLSRANEPTRGGSGEASEGSAPGGSALASSSSSSSSRLPPPPSSLQPSSFPLRPIGRVRSVFSTKNGTPRQPGLVSAARASLTLRAGLQPALLSGLEEHSHAWILFVFHANTDLGRLWTADPDRGLRGKVRVPRLDGARRGTLATRSPHRPNPLGLTLARVIRVRGREVIFGGCDLVDGTPVLDVKPYAAFCDDPKQHDGGEAVFFSPPWVVPEVQPDQGEEEPQVGRGEQTQNAQQKGETDDQESDRQQKGEGGSEKPARPQPGAADVREIARPQRAVGAVSASGPSARPNPSGPRKFEPLRIARLETTPQAERALRDAWAERARRAARGDEAPLMQSADAFVGLVTSVLSRDLRSVANRVGAPKRAQALGGTDRLALGQTSGGAGGREGGAAGGKWHVVLDGVDVDYDVDDQDVVRVRGAEVWNRLDE